MSPSDRAWESATVNHVALSVGDLDAMVQFYGRLGFDECDRVDLSPVPVRVATLRNGADATIELTRHAMSLAAPVPSGPVEAAARRGLFHLAFTVTEMERAIDAAIDAGATLVTTVRTNTRRDAWFAYLADPEGNLIELLSPIAPEANRSARRPSP